MRILRSTVMVRVGGGWVALDEFLVKNDPCRGRFINNIIEGSTMLLSVAMLTQTLVQFTST